MWSCDDFRPAYLEKLRAKLRKFRDLRGQDRNKYEAKTSPLWKHVNDARPMVYRHMLLEAMTSTDADVAASVPDAWAELFKKEAIQSAKELFHCVHNGPRMRRAEGAGVSPRPFSRYTAQCAVKVVPYATRRVRPQ